MIGGPRKPSYSRKRPADHSGCDDLDWFSNAQDIEESPVEGEDREFDEDNGRSVEQLSKEEVDEEMVKDVLVRLIDRLIM